jgi:hypothetical protein
VGKRRENGEFTVSNFVRGEYIRGFVSGLLELYFVIKHEGDVQAGFHVFSSEQSIRPRRLVNALNSIPQWLCNHEDWMDADKTCRRLGLYIRKVILDFDHEFGVRVFDPTKCDFGVLSFPPESFSEEQLIEFYDELQSIRQKPDCEQCNFRRQKQDEINQESIDLYSQAQREKYSMHKGYVNQAKFLEQAVNSPKVEPSCWYCDRLGDTIIALSSPKTHTLLTGDKSSFVALGDILGLKVELVPSLKELREPPNS